jgi:hypothetical protein
MSFRRYGLVWLDDDDDDDDFFLDRDFICDDFPLRRFRRLSSATTSFPGFHDPFLLRRFLDDFPFGILTTFPFDDLPF